MARYRKTPTCSFCGEHTHKAMYHKQASWQAPVIGDSFSHWEDLGHKCKGSRKQDEELRETIKMMHGKFFPGNH